MKKSGQDSVVGASPELSNEAWFSSIAIRLWHLRAPRGAAFCLAAVLLFFSWLTERSCLREYAWIRDLFIVLDGAWRIIHGQRPHVDFYTPLGPIAYLAPVLGLAFGGGDIHGVAWTTGLLGAGIGMAAYAIARRSVAFVPSMITSLLISLIFETPLIPGEPNYYVTLGESYNRLGYALCAIILLEATTFAGDAGRRKADTAAGCIGLVCGLLIFLKISYAPAGIFLFGVSFLFGRRRRALIPFAIGLLLATVVVFSFLHFNVAAMIADMRIAAGAKSFHLKRFPQLLLSWPVALALMPVLACLVDSLGTDRNIRLAYAYSIAAIAVVCCDLVILLGNTQGWGPYLLTLTGVFSVVLADVAARRLSGNSHYQRVTLASIILICSTLTLCSFMQSFWALGFGAYSGALLHQGEAVTKFSESTLSGLVVASWDNSGSAETQYVESVNEGIALLKQNSPKSESVGAMAFSNPFSFSLGRPPAPHGAIWLHYKTTFDDRYKPSPDLVFGSCNVIMVAKDSSYNITEPIARSYLPYILSHFHLIAESASWILYRHN